MLARVHRLVQVLDPLLDGREVLGLGELDEVGRLAHRDLGDHLQGGAGGAARAIAVAARVCWWGWGWGGGGEGGQTRRRVAFEGRSRGGRRCRRSAEMQEMQRCRGNGEVGAMATCFSASALCVLLKQTA